MSSVEEPSWEIRWDAELRVLFVRLQGPMTVQATMDVLREIAGGSDWPPDAPAVWDLRGSSFPTASADTLARLADRRAQISARRDARVAMVADGDLNFGLMRMFGMLSGGGDDAFRVFRDLDAAVGWASAR